MSDLTLVGKGANSKVYRYSKPYGQGHLHAVVKIGTKFTAKNYQVNLDKLKHAGLMTIAFADPCNVEGKPAVIMLDLNAGDEIWVSPNTVRNGHHSEAEDYIIDHKIEDIANMDDLLAMMRDIAWCTNSKGIGLDMDMIFFGMKKDENIPLVRYCLVGIDAMLSDPSMAYELKESNTIAAKEAITLFVQYFVKPGDRQKELFDLIDKYDW